MEAGLGVMWPQPRKAQDVAAPEAESQAWTGSPRSLWEGPALTSTSGSSPRNAETAALAVSHAAWGE